MIGKQRRTATTMLLRYSSLIAPLCLLWSHPVTAQDCNECWLPASLNIASRYCPSGGQIVVVQSLSYSNGKVTSTIRNNSACDLEVTLIVADIYQPDQGMVPCKKQQIYSETIKPVPAGATVSFEAMAPLVCKFQADLFLGRLPFSDDPGGRVIQGCIFNQNGPYCTPEKTSTGCPKTQGFWKNHPDAWPATSLKLGTRTYMKVQLLKILHEPVRGNGLISLAHQLIAAKLNLLVSGASLTDVGLGDALIGSLYCPPFGKGWLHTSVTAVVTLKLDGFNNSAVIGCVDVNIGKEKSKEEKEKEDEKEKEKEKQDLIRLRIRGLLDLN